MLLSDFHYVILFYSCDRVGLRVVLDMIIFVEHVHMYNYLLDTILNICWE